MTLLFPPPFSVHINNSRIPKQTTNFFVRLSVSHILQLNEAESVYLPSTENTNLMRTETRVRLHLQASHFRTMDQQKTGLVLRCTARIGNFYHVYTEITLGTPYKDPVPERGRFECSSCLIFSLTSFHLLYYWPQRLTIRNTISHQNIAPAGRELYNINTIRSSLFHLQSRTWMAKPVECRIYTRRSLFPHYFWHCSAMVGDNRRNC